MRRHSKPMLCLAVLVLAVLPPAEAAAQREGFPDVACPAGVPTSPNRHAVRARRVLLQGRPSEALPGAQIAIRTDPGNPQHHFLLGRLAVATAAFSTADSAFRRAVEICPAFSAEVDPQRAQAFMLAFQQGMAAYSAGDTAGAVARWEAANRLYTRLPDAWYNLAVVYGQRGEMDRSAHAYREALRVIGELPAPLTPEEAAARAETRRTALAGLLSVAVELFNREGPSSARELFAYLAGVDPNNRDAWYNHALALYRLNDWAALIPVAERVTRIDPLNYNARIILFNAHKGLSEAARGAPGEVEHRNHALAVLEAAEALPVHVDQVAIAAPAGGGSGRVTGNAAPAGRIITLEFTVYRPDGQTAAATATVAAPARGQESRFEFTIPAGPVASWSYTFR